MKTLRISCMFGGFLFLVLSLSAQTFTSLHSFDNTDGAIPAAALVQDTNGEVFGTTEYGGANGDGAVFEITPSGKLTTLYSFCSQGGSNCTDGRNPTAGLVQATNGDLYGTTYNGGANGANCEGNYESYGCGTVFKITPSGKLTTLYSFCSQPGCTTDGANPAAGLIQATNGDLYGTTYNGGANGANCEVNSELYGCGTVFKITPSGKLTALYSFCSQAGCTTDGANPAAGLIQATNGDLYGTTYVGGAGYGCYEGCGTIFKITPSGTLTTLYNFCSQSNCRDGAIPAAALVQDTNGEVFGTTEYGGARDDGTIFEITLSDDALTTLYSFCSQGGSNCPDGRNPTAGLVQATDGNLYGTAQNGGARGDGTIFEITLSDDALTTLHTFAGTDGEYPMAGLVQDTNGDFYGTTEEGGANDYGSVFSLSVGLGPFVETNPTSGKVGAAVKILGTDLTGATSVTFNGTAAAFRVVSSSEITTKVPKAASTGPVQIVTPGGTLTSNVNFQVN